MTWVMQRSVQWAGFKGCERGEGSIRTHNSRAGKLECVCNNVQMEMCCVCKVLLTLFIYVRLLRLTRSISCGRGRIGEYDVTV